VICEEDSRLPENCSALFRATNNPEGRMITIAITRIERKVWIGSLVIRDIDEKKVAL
jgi:hypothetical protein